MKYIKTYNERLGDKLSAPTTEEILKKLPLDDPKYILNKGFKFNHLGLIKYVIENDNVLNYLDSIKNMIFGLSKEIVEYLLSIPEIKNNLLDDEIYILEKYSLGMHQNEEKPYENQLYNYLHSLNKRDLNNIIYYTNNNKINILIHYFFENKIYVNYDVLYYDSKLENFINRNINYWAINFVIDTIIKKLIKIDNIIIKTLN